MKIPDSIPPLPDGILLVDKPAGITSFRVVDRLKKRFRIKKVGHGGSLDPMATGLLIILINRGTKLASGLLGGEKEYEATVLLGTETDSQDITGKVVSVNDKVKFTRDEIEKALETFRGEIRQIPPMVSALKHQGERLYKIARRGEVVERAPRTVTISSLILREVSGSSIRIDVRSSKGTYIRTLSHDLGRLLGCGGCLSALRRTRVGPYNIRDAFDFDELLKGTRERLAECIIPAGK
jgi:tRNA pseudouridine55 synthase